MGVVYSELRQWHDVEKGPLNKTPFVLRQDAKVKSRLDLVLLRRP